jgi:hypothetical protein
MAPKSGSVLNKPRTAVEIAEFIESCRYLIRVADARLDSAKSDLSALQRALAEVQLELRTGGFRRPEEGSDGGGGQAR